MNLRRIKYWVFDMDGTLTVATHDFDAIRRTLGLSLGRPILEQLAGLPPHEAEPLHEQLEVIEREHAGMAAAQAGAHELLTVLGSRGDAFGILTRNRDATALDTLRACGLLDYFDPECVLGRDSCELKPSPDGIRRLLARWGGEPHEAAIVGDFLFDLMAGRDAGTATVYIDPTEEYRWAQHADAALPNLSALVELLNNYN